MERPATAILSPVTRRAAESGLAQVLGRLGVRWNESRHRLLGEGAWVAFGQVAAALGTLVGVRLVTELVPPSTYGVVTLLLGVSVLGTNLFCAPLLQAAVRFHPEMAAQGRLAALRRHLTRILLGTTAALAGLILLGGLGSAEPWWTFGALAALLIADVWRTMETNFLAAARRQRPVALWLAADAWARPLLALVAVQVWGASAGVVLLGYAAASALGWLVFKRVLGAGTPGWEASASGPGRLDPEQAKAIGRYALPLIPLALVGWVTSLSDRYVIGGMLGLEQVGIYAAAYGLVSRPMLMAGNIVLNTLRPVYFRAVSDGDRAGERRALRVWLTATSGVFALALVLIALWREPVAALLLAERYRAGAEFMVWMALGGALLGLSYVFNTVSLAYKRSWFVFWSELTGALTSLGAGVALTWRFGLAGAAGAVPLCFLAQLLVGWRLSRVARRAAGAPAASDFPQ